MTLNRDEKNAIIQYRIEKSDLTFKEAKDNAALGNWSLTANRLYYSTFYLALAINLSYGEISKTHNGTFSIFSKNFIATGLLSKEEGSLYRRLFTMRQTGDYDDLFDWEEEDVMPIIPLVSDLLKKMKTLIQ